MAVLVAGTMASAQDTPPDGDGPGNGPGGDPLDGLFSSGADIDPSEWRRMVQGRTVIYQIGSETWAYETYAAPGSDLVAILLADGTCMDGTWYHRNLEFCYAWSRGETSCFRHVRVGDEILVIPMVDGAPSGSVQTVSGISDKPIVCGPALSS